MNTGTYQHQQGRANAFVGSPKGLIDGWPRRHSVGLSYDDNSYQKIPGQSPDGELPSASTMIR